MASMWDARYISSDARFFYGTSCNSFLEAQEPRLPRGSRILCLAEGEGRNAVALALRGHTVTSMDLSPVGVAKTLALAARSGIHVDASVGDLETFAIAPGAWDAIVSVWAHVPHPLRQRLHRAVVAGLRPGGHFIFEAYHPRQLELVRAGTSKGGPGSAELLATLHDVTAELAGLELVVAGEVERDVQEGEGHAGMSAVTHLVGVKVVT